MSRHAKRSETFGNLNVGKKSMPFEEQVPHFLTYRTGVNAQTRLDSGQPLSASERVSLRRQARLGKASFDKLFYGNLKLVMSTVMKMRTPSGLELDDMFQGGSFGLKRAIEKFDVERGFAFSTYATPWIRQAAVRFCGQQRMVHIPVNVETVMGASIRSDDPMAQRALDASRFAVVFSADGLAPGTDDLSVADSLACERPGPEMSVCADEWSSQFLGVLDSDQFTELDRATARVLFEPDGSTRRGVDVAKDLGVQPATASLRIRALKKRLASHLGDYEGAAELGLAM